MKATKYIAAAVIAATALGVATPTFAAVGVDTSNVGVTIRTANEGEEEFVLKTVPSNYEFTSPINYNGKYEITTTSESKVTAFKNFESGDEDKFIVSASVSKLTLNGDKTNKIAVKNFSINNVSIGSSTGGSAVLFGDTDFDNQDADTKDYYIDITEATIQFKKEGLKLNDVLTGKVLYTHSAVADPGK